MIQERNFCFSFKCIVCSTDVKLLASKLVEQWLKIVKGETEAVRAQQGLVAGASGTKSPSPPLEVVKEEPKASEEVKRENITATAKLDNLEPKVEIQKLIIKTEETTESVTDKIGNGDAPLGQLPVYKITFKDGKRVLAKVFSGEKLPAPKDSAENMDNSAPSDKSSASVVTKPSDPVLIKNEDIKKEVEDTSVKVNLESNKVISSKIKVKSEKLENNVDAQKSVKDSVKKSKDSSKSSDKDKKFSKDKIKDRERTKDKSRDSKSRDKDRDSSKIKDKKSSSSNSDKVSDISEKDKATLAKLIPPAISKLGKIPKKSKTDDASKSASATETKKPSSGEVKKPAPAPEPVPSKKPSISIESRKLGDPSNRPKTVKTFNSKFRSTGLEEEAKPPPSRQGKKVVIASVDKKLPPSSLPVKFPSLKRPSPPKDLSTPPEKKMKPTDGVAEDAKKEKSGGIKLIPPRPKRKYG